MVFEGGDPRRPYVVGGLWNGTDRPPESMDGGGRNLRKTLRSRNGVKVTLDDHDGQETLTLETPAGQQLTLRDGPGPGTVEIQDSNGNSVALDGSGITLTTSLTVSVHASRLECFASVVTVNSGISRFSGVVQCETLITNSVISASYTPGAGNIW